MKKILMMVVLITVIAGCSNAPKLEKSRNDGYSTYQTISYGSMRMTYDTKDIKAVKIIELIDGLINLADEMKR